MEHALDIVLKDLSDSQWEAVNWCRGAGALLVLAGPGSGKTRMLTCRIARLLDESRDERFRILALTFTNKAAHELERRVKQLVPGIEYRAVINTFHSFCAQVLRQHGGHVGVKTNFAIFSRKEDRLAVLEDALRRDARRYARDTSRLLHYIDRLKEGLVLTVDAVAELSNWPGIGPEAARLISRAYGNYEKELRRANALDFNSLLLKAYELFGFAAIARHYQLVYRYWHIDEFQDTNKAQYRLLRRMASRDFRDIFVVADEDQVIYEWNGASVSRIRDFRRDFSSETKYLPTNYRCPPRIVKAANRLVSRNRKRDGMKPNTRAARRKTNGRARAIQWRSFRTDDAEARFIAAEIAKLDGAARGKTAVLARARYLLEPVHEALQDRRVPSAVLKRRDDFLTPEMNWLVACLEQVNRPRDVFSFRAVVMSFDEIAGLELALEGLDSQAEAERVTSFSLWLKRVRTEALESRAEAYVSGIEKLWAKQLNWRAAAKETTDKFEHDDSNPDLQTDLTAWRQLLRKIRERNSNVSLDLFLQQLQMHSKEPDVPRDAVRLATIHGAKGLEFDTVYLIGMAEDILPTWRSSRRGKYSPQLEEERRSCFVAITRASQSLHLSWARRYNGRQRHPSRFLREMFGADDFGRPRSPASNELAK